MELYNRNSDVSRVSQRKWFCVSANKAWVVESNVDMKMNVNVFNALWRIINGHRKECLYCNSNSNNDDVIHCLNIEKAIAQLISQVNILLIAIVLAITFMLYKLVYSLLLSSHIISLTISVFISLILSLVSYTHLFSQEQPAHSHSTIERDNTAVSKWIQSNQVSLLLRMSAFLPCTSIRSNNNIHLFTSFMLNSPTLSSHSESIFPNMITKRISTFQDDCIILTDTYETTPLISYVIQSSKSNITHMKMSVYINIALIIDNCISLDVIDKVLTYLDIACALYERESFDSLVQLNNTGVETQINEMNNVVETSEWSDYALLGNYQGISVMYRALVKCFGFNVQFTLANTNLNSLVQRALESCNCVSFALVNADNDYSLDVSQSNVGDGFYTYVNDNEVVNLYVNYHSETQVRIYCLNGNHTNNKDNKECYSGVMFNSPSVNANSVVVTYFEYCSLMNKIDTNIDGNVVSKETIIKYINLFNRN